MKRGKKFIDDRINPIMFKNNSLVFQFAKSKGYQNGVDRVGTWHVYANPHEPHLCPVLAISRYLFTYPELLGTQDFALPRQIPVSPGNPGCFSY